MNAAVGNLIHLTQGSNTAQPQHRYFKYDAMSRLTYERQVEQATAFTVSDALTGNSQWSRKVVYDETINGVSYKGLMTSMYDARGIQTQHQYDNLNRPYRVSYSDGTPTLTNNYDQPRNGYFNKGKLTEAVTDAVGDIPQTSQVYDFDLMGRVAKQTQSIGGNSYTLSYAYNVGGQLIRETYPSGRTVNLGYDEASRLSQVNGGGNHTFISAMTYTAQGTLSAATLGNDVNCNYEYNTRWQPNRASFTKNNVILQKYEYKYGQFDPTNGTIDETKNNGQVAQVESWIGIQKQWQQSFTYDQLGRLNSAREKRGDNNQQTYLLNYAYDIFGNRYQYQANNGGNPFLQKWVEAGDINQATNRFVSGVGYDAAGNVTSDPRFRNLEYQYDANGRQKQSSQPNGVNPVKAIYDGTGQRIATQVNGALTAIMVYDAVGKLVAEYGQTPPSTASLQYVMADHQGSVRLVLNSSGGVVSRHDYQPFGDEIYAGVGMRATGQSFDNADNVRQKYTGMEADDATGMGHTLWRKYDDMSGRWTTPDPYGGSMTVADPQSFNRYSYVNNDPVNEVDPSGLMSGADEGWDSAGNGFWGSWSDSSHTSAGQATVRAREDGQNRALADTRQAKLINDGVKDGTITRDQAEEMVANNPNLELEGGSSANASGQSGDQQYSPNAIMIIIWDPQEGTKNPVFKFGHVSYITMEDDTSFSWQGEGTLFNQWKKDTPSSNYTNERSEQSSGRGYILDFGSKLNAKFIAALKDAYGSRPYDPVTNNCGKGFNKAMNSIRKELGIKESARMILPSKTEAYIQRNLGNYIRAVQPFTKRSPDDFIASK